MSKQNTISFRNYFLISFLVLLAEIIINPIGEFPLNDDWSYSLPLYWFWEGKKLELVNWGAMTLVAHLWWGMFIIKIFGFSFSILRISVVFLGLISTLIFYKTIFEATRNASISFLASLLLFFNPFYFLLSNSFMTETPFCFCAIMTFYCAWRYYSNPENIFYTLGICIFCVLGVLIRQIGIIFPLAIFCSAIFTFSIRKIIFSVFPLILSIAAILLFEYWVKMNNIQLSYYKSSAFLSTMSVDIISLLWVLMLRNGVMWNYLGFFMLPLTVPITVSFLKSIKKQNIKWLILFSFLPIFMSIRGWHEIPVQNLIYDFGLGPQLMPYLYHNLINNRPNVFSSSFIVLKIIFELGAICLSITIFAGMFSLGSIKKLINAKSPQIQFGRAVVFSIILYMIYFFSNTVIDRHYVVLVPLFIYIIVPLLSKNSYYLIAVCLLMLITMFSVLGTKDYFTYNKTNLKAVNCLKKRNVSKFEYNAGFEHSGWYHYNKNKPRDWDSFMYQPTQKYLIVNKPVPNYEIDTVLYYQRCFLPKKDSIMIVKKNQQM